jgi:tetratricopeptide (TPR) repeat protein
MKKIIQTVSYAVLLIGTPASTNATDTTDDQIIAETESAIRSGNFQTAIEKADTIIKRFEGRKEENSNYVCTSGGADTLTALLGVATANTKATNSTDDKKDKTSAISSTICDAYFLKGFAHVDLKQRDQALVNFEKAVSLDPDNQQYMNELAEWYKTGGQWQKSLEIFIAASEKTDMSIEFMDDKKKSKQIMNEMRCRSYRGIAFNQAEMRQWDLARKALNSCLKLIPNDPQSKAELEYIKANSRG